MKYLFLLLCTGCITTPKDFDERLSKLERQVRAMQVDCTLARFSPCD